MDSNRLNQLSAAQTIGKQSQQTDFGSVFAQTVSSGAGVAGQVISGVVGATPVLSSAVTGVSALARTARGAVAPVGGGGGLPVPGGSASAATDFINVGDGQVVPVNGQEGAIQSLLAEMTSNPNGATQTQYLELQLKMQQQNQIFTTISNVLKMKHDTVKTAINNVH